MVRIVGLTIPVTRKKECFGVYAFYIITLIISFLLIIIAGFLNNNVEILSNVIMGIACSGFAAALMAIFLEMTNKKTEKRKIEDNRYIALNGINIELKKFFERLIWFDKVLDRVDMNRENEYYYSLDFLRDWHRDEDYECIDFEEASTRIESLIDKYSSDTKSEKSKKMFTIIRNASYLVNKEMDKLKDNRLLLIINGILSEEDFGQFDIIKPFFTKGFSGGNIIFIWNIYKLIKSIGGFKDSFYITWQVKGDIDDMCAMVINDKKKNSCKQRENGRKRKKNG